MKLFLSLILFCSFVITNAQQELHCASDKVQNAIYKKHPELKQKYIDARTQQIQRMKNNPDEINMASFTIPVVFHVLHQGGPENISDAQVIDAMNILNRDFAKQNADLAEVIPSMQVIADSMQIQFALATIDPNGNCTNGIIHHYDANTDWYDSSATLYSHSWDATKYMNVYVVRRIILSGGFGAAGYTYFPGTWPDGDPADAIVLLNNYFGAIGTSSNFTSRVLTHEVGHWLGLAHVFGFNGAGQDCFNDDMISDTPTTAGFVSCADVNDPSTYQLCTPGVDENFQNYMDYSYCVRMFTQEQGFAMRTTLMTSTSGRDNLVSNANLIATGVINPMVPCTPIADFTYSRNKVCVGSPVTFFDASQAGTPTSYTWTLTGSNIPSSNLASPTVFYPSPGLYSATYTSANSAGTSAPITKTDIIEVVLNTAEEIAPYQEPFATDVFSAQEWSTGSSSGGSQWTYNTDASAGTGDNSSVVIPYAGNTRQMHTWMYSPRIDINNIPTPTLSYWFAGQETNPNHVNVMCVSITTDCGETWTDLECLTGMDLATAGIGAQGYIPFDASEWVQHTVDLSAFVSAVNPVQFKFEYIRDTISAANNFYLDDINIISPIGIKENKNTVVVNVFPNPSNGEVNISWTGTASAVYATDVFGRVIEHAPVNANQQQTKLFTHKAPASGIYFVHVVMAGKEEVRKVVVK